MLLAVGAECPAAAGLIPAGHELLDSVLDKLRSGHVMVGMDELIPGLLALRQNGSAGDWAAFSESCLQHPIRQWLHEDPFTWRSFAKPRGYPGDAIMLDLAYFADRPPAGTSAIGEQIFRHSTHSPACRSVRARCVAMAHTIDAIARERPRICAVACGHLRESKWSRRIQTRDFADFVAFDQDRESLRVVSEEYGGHVSTVHGSIRHLLTGRRTLQDFDLIYAAGLFDYLEQRVAERLVAVLFEGLRPGGSLIIGNFCPTLSDIGYMETFMQWHLIFRTTEDLHDLATALHDDPRARCGVSVDAFHNIAYLTIERVA